MPGRWAKIQVVEAASAELNTICHRTNTARNGASRPIIRWSRRITPRRVRTLPNRWALANNAGVNGKRARLALPGYGRQARVTIPRSWEAVARPAPVRTGDEREPLAATGVRGSSVHRGPPSHAWRIVWSASPMVPFSNLRFISVRRAKIRERNQISSPHDNWC